MAHHPPQVLPHEHAAPDEWHSHSAAEGLPQRAHGAKTNPGILALITGGFVLAVVLTVALTMLYFSSYMTTQRRTKAETTVLSEEYRTYRAQTQAALNGYGWADPAAGTVRIPIERAMDKVVEAYHAQNGH